MSFIGTIEHFNLQSNIDTYLERMDQLFTCNEVTENKQVSVFLTLIGPDCYGLLKNLLSPDVPSVKTYKQLKDRLRQHFNPQKNVIAERFKFHKYDQSINETITEYIVKLKDLSKNCEFGTFLQEALRDRLVCGLVSEKIQSRLLSEDKLTFNNACKIGISMELTEIETKSMQPNFINKVKLSGQFKKPENVTNNQSRSQSGADVNYKNKHQSSSYATKQCFRCGRNHNPEICRAKSWECFFCHKMGHTSKMCRKRQSVHLVAEDESCIHGSSQNEEGEDSHESVKSCKQGNIIKNGKVDPVNVIVKIYDVNINMEVDTGASVSVMCLEFYKQYFSNIPIKLSMLKVKTVSGDHLSVVGEIVVSVSLVQSSLIHALPIIIVESKYNFAPLLGRNWLDILLPLWRNSFETVKNVVTVSQEFTVNQINQYKRSYPKVFSNDKTQSIKELKANIVLKDNVTPVFCKPYSIPYSIRGKVDEQLDDMVKNGILIKVRHSEFASPVVIVPRKSGKSLRICVDFKVSLNPLIKVDHYPLPLVEEIFYKVADGKFFCVLDLSNAYLQLEVSQESQHYLTINTHKGLFSFTRLPFGIACAPAQFQATMDEILKGLNKTACYIDDIIVTGESMEECQSNLHKVLSRLNEYNVQINLDKCIFFAEKVEFLGHELSAKGISPLKSKVEAIQNAPSPQNLQQLRSYLGLLNYYNRFLPMLSTCLHPLYNLERKYVKYEWTDECQIAFEKSKQMLLNSTCLVPYSLKYPIIVASDSSPYGVGCVLSHIIDGVERPVMFCSSTLSSAESKYSQLYREALGLIYAVKKFHKFIYGRSFTLLTDHMPLKSIFNPKKNIPTLAAARLQRWALILSSYQYDIKYRKGSEMSNADAMSRLPLPELCEEAVYSFSSFFEIPLTALNIAECTKRDSTLVKVIEYARVGWPDKIDELNLKPYFNRRHELSIENDCLLYGNRVIIPYQLRENVLELLHNQHVGVVRMKMLARSEVFWPNIDEDLENFVKNCESCQLLQPKAVSIPLAQWPKSSRVFQRVHVDFFQKFDRYFFILVDSYSRWLEIYITPSTNYFNTVEILRKIFATFGFCEEIVSDNGPPFNSEQYRKFCLSHGIKCTLSPPLHPCSNGLAEKYVGTVKNNLTKQLEDNKRQKVVISLQSQIDNFLLSFRNTPNSVTGVTPASLVLKQSPKTKLSLLRPAYLEGKRESKISNKVKEYVDNKRGSMRVFFEGQKVIVFNKNNRRWEKGRIAKVVSPVTYLVIINNVVKYIHADYLKESKLFDVNEIPNENNDENNVHIGSPLSSSVEIPENKNRHLFPSSENNAEVSSDAEKSLETQVPCESPSKVIKPTSPIQTNFSPMLRRSSRTSKPPQRLIL